MLRPDSIYDLVEFPRNRFAFPFLGWQREFGIYNWFYVTHAQTVIARSGIFQVSTLVRFRETAIYNCPEQWKEEFPFGSWDELAPVQLYRIAKGKTLRFDKACLGILCLEAAVAERSSKIDVYEMVKIDPALFVVDGLDDLVRQQNREIMLAAAVHTKQSLRFIERAGREGQPMTYKTASELAEFLNDRGYRRCEVRMIVDRTDRGNIRTKQPLSEERVWG
jgi:hypothetical protein